MILNLFPFLKDAAAKAVYGSQAGNGVIIIKPNQSEEWTFNLLIIMGMLGRPCASKLILT